MNTKQNRMLILAVLMFLLSISSFSAVAQDSTPAQPATISFEGVITESGDNFIIVNGLTVITSDFALDFTVFIGASIKINGILQTDGTIIPIDIDFETEVAEITPEPEATAEATPEAEDETGAIIIIEGPVQQININIVTIYNISIALNPDDPILTQISIGDVLRIEGQLDMDDEGTIVFSTDENNTNILIVAINVVIVNVNLYVNPADPNDYWRDTSECANPPPPWAPAVGWRRKCGSAPVLPPGQAKKKSS